MNTAAYALYETHAWVLTDAEGRAQVLSSRIHDVLGEPRLDRGDDLVSRRCWRRKAVLFAMKVALTGWPAERTVIMAVTYKVPLPGLYRVSRERYNVNLGQSWVVTVVESADSVQHATSVSSTRPGRAAPGIVELIRARLAAALDQRPIVTRPSS